MPSKSKVTFVKSFNEYIYELFLFKKLFFCHLKYIIRTVNIQNIIFLLF
jgi:hypothetical protein